MPEKIISQKSHTCYIASFLLKHLLNMSSSSTNTSGGLWCH